MMLKLWVLLLLISVANFKDQEDLKPARYASTHLSNGHLAFMVTEESPNMEVVTEELPNWQIGSVQQKLDKLKSDLGTERYQRCLNQFNTFRTPRLETGNQLIENPDFKFCILSEKWLQLIPNSELINLRTRKSSKLFQDSNKKYNYYRYIQSCEKRYDDCMFNTRKTIKPYPGNCYWDCCVPNETRSNEWWAFWSHIGGDLMYTYDFVLYDSILPDGKENQLWYLIAFLQNLANLLYNPFSIIKEVKEKKYAKWIGSMESQMHMIEEGLSVLESIGLDI